MLDIEYLRTSFGAGCKRFVISSVVIEGMASVQVSLIVKGRMVENKYPFKNTLRGWQSRLNVAVPGALQPAQLSDLMVFLYVVLASPQMVNKSNL